MKRKLNIIVPINKKVFVTWLLKMILLSALSLQEWIQVFVGKKMGPSVKPWTTISIRWNSLSWRFVIRTAPGRPKSDWTLKSAAYSTIDGWLDGLGNQPLTATSALLLPVRVAVQRYQRVRQATRRLSRFYLTVNNGWQKRRKNQLSCKKVTQHQQL